MFVARYSEVDKHGIVLFSHSQSYPRALLEPQDEAFLVLEGVCRFEPAALCLVDLGVRLRDLGAEFFLVGAELLAEGGVGSAENLHGE